MLSRRRFVGGAGALAAAGAAGAAAIAVVGSDRVLRRLGLHESPDHRVPYSGRAVEEHTLHSGAMGGEVRWAIAMPPTPALGSVICLHGRNCDHRQAFDSMFLHDVVASLGAPLAIVGVDGGPTSYWHPRADGTDAMRMVIEELLPAVDDVMGAAAPRALLGWSMGGYGAVLLAERAPDLFCAVAAASPALFHGFDDSTEGAFDSEDDYARHDVFAASSALDDLAVRIDCGRSDPFIDRSMDFAAQLPGANLGGFTAGYHDDPYWRNIAPRQIATINTAVSAATR